MTQPLRRNKQIKMKLEEETKERKKKEKKEKTISNDESI